MKDIVLFLLREIGFFTLAGDNPGCPCYDIRVCGIQIQTHCWRSHADCCEYSGIHVTGDGVPEEDLKEIAEEVLHQITDIWDNTTFEIRFEEPLY